MESNKFKNSCKKCNHYSKDKKSDKNYSIYRQKVKKSRGDKRSELRAKKYLNSVKTG